MVSHTYIHIYIDERDRYACVLLSLSHSLSHFSLFLFMLGKEIDWALGAMLSMNAEYPKPNNIGLY